MSYWTQFVAFVGHPSAGISDRYRLGSEDLLDRLVTFIEHRSRAKDLPVTKSRSEPSPPSPTHSQLNRTRPLRGDIMTTDNADHIQQKVADTKPDVRSKLDQLSDDTLRRVAVGVALGMVIGCVVLATTNAGSEQHTWWGWLLIGAPMTWLAFLGLVALTSGALRTVVRALRWSFSLTSRNSAEISVRAARRTGSNVRHFDVSISGLASLA
jgi:hypothetical protein